MEVWKDIAGFENYMVSNRGRIYSKKETNDDETNPRPERIFTDFFL